MAYIPETKREFYENLGSMIMRCPDYRSSIPASDHGLEKSFEITNQSIAILYPDAHDPIRQQLLRMSGEAKRLSKEASDARSNGDDERRKKCTLESSQIFVDMERLMKGKELMYYSE